MPALITGAHPAARPRLVLDGPGREGRADYERRGGYRPGLEGQDLVTAVTEAELRGRGGAAFPLGVKLAAVAGRPGEHVVVANGEEGEPASVKDRWLLRTRPHLVIDGALRAASAVAADTVYVYVSDPAAARSLRAALAELDGPPASVQVWEVEPGYVAGEETAAVNAINGRPAKPSDKPPRPFEEGVRGLPTLVSNVETLANLPGIATGADPQPGTFLMTLGGACGQPGLYEVPFGITLGEVAETLGGLGGAPRGYLMGGYFAGLVNERGHALPLDYDVLAAEGSGLGCGSVTVLGPGRLPVRRGRAAAGLLRPGELGAVRVLLQRHRGHGRRGGRGGPGLRGRRRDPAAAQLVREPAGPGRVRHARRRREHRPHPAA